MKNKLKPIFVSVAAITGAVVGVLWFFAGQATNSAYWQYWQWQPRFVKWIAYASCPFLDLDLHRLSIVVVSLLNSIIYGLLGYVILRSSKRPAILAKMILGYAVAVFWVIAVDAGMNGADWPPNWESWLAYVTCPLVGFIGASKIASGLIPLLNALYVLSLVYMMRRFAKRPAILTVIIVGYVIGMFWVIAVDAGMNGADWPPNWESWLAYATCPLVGFISVSGPANGLVPLLNALYWLLVYALLKMIYRKIRPSCVWEED